jgi:hypothetical protein
MRGGRWRKELSGCGLWAAAQAKLFLVMAEAVRGDCLDLCMVAK